MSNFFARLRAADANEIKRSLGALVGIAQGLLCDKKLTDDEIVFLDKWLRENDAIANAWPGDIIHARVRSVLADDIITEAERAYLVDTLSQLIGGSFDQLPGRTHVTELAFDDIDKVRFDQTRFCLTGEFVFAPRDICATEIEKRGGIVGGVTKKLRYVVVGSLGSPEWKHGSFGTKIEKAMQYKRAGVQILIVSEDVWAASL